MVAGGIHLKRQGRPEEKGSLLFELVKEQGGGSHSSCVMSYIVHNNCMGVACWVTLILGVTKLRLSNLPRGHMVSV